MNDTRNFDQVRAGAQGDDRYVAPQIQTFSPEEFLGLIGPAQGYGGGGGVDGGGRRVSGRGYRLYPGLR